MTKLMLSMAPIAAANVLFGFFNHGYIFLEVGPGIQTDAFYAGMAVPQLVLSVLTGALFYVVVPLLAGEDEEQLSQGAWGFFFLVGGFVGAFALGLFILATFWVPLLLPGFSHEGLSLCVQLTRIQLVGMVFSALNCVLRAAYHARQNFFWPEFSQLMESVVGLGALVWALPIFGIYAAAAVYVLRAILLTLLLLPGLGSYSNLDWRSLVIRRAWSRMKPLAFAALYYKSGPLVDRFLTSMTPAGGLSLFYFSQQLYEAANHLIGRAVAGPVLPLLAVHKKSGKPGLFKRTYRARLLVVLGVGVATVVLFLVLVEPLLRLRQEIDDEGVRVFWWITVGLAGFFIGGAMGQVLSSAFYAQGDVQTPTQVGIIGFTLGIGLKVIGFLLSGLLGIAVATSFYYMGNALAMYLLLERKDDALSD